MTLKSTLDIDLDDSKFQRFVELFKRYDEALKKQPEIWKKIGGIHQQHAENFAEIAETMGKIGQLRHKNLLDVEAEEKHLATSSRLWTSIAASTKGMALNIGAATTALIRWSGILGAVGGILGAGGLFGIDRMAAGLSGQRRSAMGRGMTIGQQTAFGVNFGRLLDTDSYLDWIAGMGQDVTKQGPAFSLLHRGLGTDTGTNALLMLDAMRDLAKHTQVNLLGTAFHARGLDESGANARMLHDMSDDEYRSLRAGYARDVTALGVSDKTALAWQNFTTQMNRAREQMKVTFETGLVGLQPQLTQLSTAFSELTKTLMQAHGTKWALGELTQVLDDLAHPGRLKNFSETPASDWLRGTDAWKSAGDWLFGTMPQAVKGWLAPDKAWAASHFDAYMARLDQRAGVGSGFLETWRHAGEASGNNAMSRKGALGQFQFMPNTWGQYGAGGDPRDPVDAANAASRYGAALAREFGGDLAKMLGISPVITWFLQQQQQLNHMFFISFLLAIISGVLFYILSRYTQTSSAFEIAARPRFISLVLEEIGHWKRVLLSHSRYPIMMVFLGACVFSSMANFQATFAEANQLNYSLYYVVYTATVIIARIFLSPYLNRFNLYSMGNIMLGIMCLGLLAFIFVASSPIMYVIATIFLGFGYGLAYPIIKAQSIEHLKETRKESALICFSLSYFLGLYIFPLCTGFLIVDFGYKVLLVVLLFLGLSELLIGIYSQSRKLRGRSPSAEVQL